MTVVTGAAAAAAAAAHDGDGGNSSALVVLLLLPRWFGCAMEGGARAHVQPTRGVLGLLPTPPSALLPRPPPILPRPPIQTVTASGLQLTRAGLLCRTRGGPSSAWPSSRVPRWGTAPPAAPESAADLN